tara:strand:+ start:249 stop:479 length:231 start_codon:yes stop_codon:yes gene_type:complete
MKIDQNPSPPIPINYSLFEYALKHPQYGFYEGTTRDSFEENFSQSKTLAYTYTLNGADVKKRRFPAMFGACEIVKI